MTIYIQYKGGEGLETIDEADTRKEARAMLREYQMSDKGGHFYLSNKPCKEWKEASKNS